MNIAMKGTLALPGLDDVCEWCAFLIMTSRTGSSGRTVNGEGDFALKIQVFHLLLSLYDCRLLSTFDTLHHSAHSTHTSHTSH